MSYRGWVLLLVGSLAAGLVVGGRLDVRTVHADPTPGTVIQVPILGWIGNSGQGVDLLIEVQNAGDRDTRVRLDLYGDYSGFCEPQSTTRGKYECSGVLRPGSAWVWSQAQIPSWAVSGILYAVPLTCPSTGSWDVPLAAEVVRKGPGVPDEFVDVSAAYSGVSQAMEGVADPVFGGFSYYAPIVFANRDGFNSWLYIQNSGSQCTSVELWFKQQDDCINAQICDVPALAPGETYRFNASDCVGPSFRGSVWIRTSQPTGVVVDHVGSDVFMSYIAKPADVVDPQTGRRSWGSQVAYGPLIYREQQGWDTFLAVQNLSSVNSAKVKVYFLDNGGGIITSLVDWVCPRGMQFFSLPAINNLPGNYTGQVRVESQDSFAVGGPPVNATNIAAIAQLIKYDGPARQQALEAIAYNLFPEFQAFDWQTGETQAWNVSRIAIPSFTRRSAQVTTELAIENVVPQPGFTDFAIYIYDQNGLVDFVCEKLNEKQTEYINLDDWGIINPGFRGSAVISATYWQHYSGTRNVVGLAAVKIERSNTVLGQDIPGDESAGSEGFPIQGPFRFAGPFAPRCPGQP
jgi:hypothetical protein